MSVWIQTGLLTWSINITAPFNNMRTLTFKAQPTNAFFATVNQMFGDSSQLPTTVERAVIKSLSTVQITKQCSALVGSWEEPPNTWLTAAKNPFVGWPSNFRVRMLLKGAVNQSEEFEVLFFCGPSPRNVQRIPPLETKSARWKSETNCLTFQIFA